MTTCRYSFSLNEIEASFLIKMLEDVIENSDSKEDIDKAKVLLNKLYHGAEIETEYIE